MFDVYLLMTLYSAAWAAVVIAAGNISDALGWKPAFPNLLRIYAWLTIIPLAAFVLFTVGSIGPEESLSGVALGSVIALGGIFLTFLLLPLYGVFLHLNHVSLSDGDNTRVLWRWAGGSVFVVHVGWFVAFHWTHLPPQNNLSALEWITYIWDPLLLGIFALYAGLALLAVMVKPSIWRLRLHGIAAGAMLTVFASRPFLLIAGQAIQDALELRVFFK